MVPLKQLNNFRRTPQMPLTNCEVRLVFTWYVNPVILYINNANKSSTFPITKTKLYLPMVALPTQDNGKSGLKMNKLIEIKNYNKLRSLAQSQI